MSNSSNSLCIIIYNPISGHGHLDSWCAHTAKALLKSGYKLVIFTQDVEVFKSNIADVYDSYQNKILFLGDLPIVNNKILSQIKKWLIKAWSVWSGHGHNYLYRSRSAFPSAEASKLVVIRKYLLRKLMPFLYKLSLNIVNFIRAVKRKVPLNESDPQFNYFHPVQFSSAAKFALKKLKCQPVLLLNLYMDYYKTDSISWREFNSENNIPWAAIRFVPDEMFRESYYNDPMLKGMCFLDETVCSKFMSLQQNKISGYLPDITNFALPNLSGVHVEEIHRRSKGRKKIFMGGSIGGQKNLSLWIQLIMIADPDQWFFVQIGEIHISSLTKEDLDAMANLDGYCRENVYVHSAYLNDEAEFNAIISSCDIIYAVYRDFKTSSNMVSKAAFFEKPIVVAEGNLMGKRVKDYNLGSVVPLEDVGKLYDSLKFIDIKNFPKEGYERYRLDFGEEAFQTNIVSFVSSCLATDLT